jgi:hypothetical protein
MALVSSSSSAPSEVTWTHPAGDLWIATARPQPINEPRFFGQVRQRAKLFYAWDRSGRIIGRFASLPTAMNSLQRAKHLTVFGILKRDGLARAAVFVGLLTVVVSIAAIPVYLR